MLSMLSGDLDRIGDGNRGAAAADQLYRWKFVG
jgi:hypothetical protein